MGTGLGVCPIRAAAADSSVMVAGSDLRGGPADQAGGLVAGACAEVVVDRMGGDRPQPAENWMPAERVQGGARLASRAFSGPR